MCSAAATVANSKTLELQFCLCEIFFCTAAPFHHLLTEVNELAAMPPGGHTLVEIKKVIGEGKVLSNAKLPAIQCRGTR
jgi:hypothetical protein